MRVDERAEEYAMTKTRGGFAKGDLKGLSNGIHFLHAFVAESEQEMYVGSVQVCRHSSARCSLFASHTTKRCIHVRERGECSVKWYALCKYVRGSEANVY